jgi:hypothetical protein
MWMQRGAVNRDRWQSYAEIAGLKRDALELVYGEQNTRKMIAEWRRDRMRRFDSHGLWTELFCFTVIRTGMTGWEPHRRHRRHRRRIRNGR